MNRILFFIGCKIFSNGPCICLFGVGCAHKSAVTRYGIISIKHHNNYSA